MQVTSVEQSGSLSQFLPMMNREFPAMAVAPDVERAEFRVLIVERSESLAKLLATGLVAELLAVDVTHGIEEARELLAANSYQLLILDLETAEAEGAPLLRTLQSCRPELRVLAMSGRSGVGDLVSALDQGADDYLLKPFSLLEMMARVRALRRRSERAPASLPKTGKLVLNRDQCRVERDGRPIDLTPREFALLDCMMQNAGKTLSRAMLTQEVWNMPADANTNIVDVYVKYLRDKIDGEHDEKLIRTVRGMGYLLQTQ